MTRIAVDRGGWALSAYVTGPDDAPPVVLSNSLGTGVAMWTPQREALEATHRVIGYDTRGHGLSGTPDGPCSFDDLIDDALAIMDHFGARRAGWAGVSLGAMTGLGLGLRAPDRLTRMVCACARADAPPPFAASWDDRMEKIDAGGLEAIWPGTLSNWLTDDFRAQRTDVVETLRRDFLATRPAGYAGCAAALKRLDYLRHLGDLTVPTLYIAGERDKGATPDTMRAMKGATPGARIEVLPDCGHIANLNADAAFTAALRAHLGD